MRLLSTDLHRHIHRTIQYYLIISYALELTGTTSAETALDHVDTLRHSHEPIKYDSIKQSQAKLNLDTATATGVSPIKNYASAECAKVIETNPEAKKATYMINAMIDEYMLNPCKTNIWFVIELCEPIRATRIEIANYELFSSTLKDFTVYFSDELPASDWKVVGKFTATDSRTLQSFDLDQTGFGKFIKVELHSHYGSEHYCPISVFKVYGNSMVEEYEKSKDIENNVTPNKITNNTLPVIQLNQKTRRRTTAYRVYRCMMMNPNFCGLSRSLEKKTKVQDASPAKPIEEEHVTVISPTQPPPVNRTNIVGLKQSIFVELSDKVKALESSLKTRIEDLEQRLGDLETRYERFTLEYRASNSNINMLTLIVIAYLVYKIMLDIM